MFTIISKTIITTKDVKTVPIEPEIRHVISHQIADEIVNKIKFVTLPEEVLAIPNRYETKGEIFVATREELRVFVRYIVRQGELNNINVII